MDAAPDGFAEEEDDEHGIDQQDVLYRVVLFLAAVTPRLFSRVLGADDAPFRSIMRKRGAACPATGSGRGHRRGCAAPRARPAAGHGSTDWPCSGPCRTAGPGPLE